MNIGLIDVDGHNFPNLALMKISKYHKLKKDTVEFCNPLKKYDIIYKSKVFTYTKDDKNKRCADSIIKGGTGYNIKDKLSKEIDSCVPDYKLYNCEHAYGFLTRGCIRNCPWCIVPEKEGKIHSYNDIEDFLDSFDSAILMDNNVLAIDHGIKQIEKIINMNIKIDFNQGLDAKLIDEHIATLLSKVKWINFIRMSCDTINNLKYVDNAIKLLNNNGIKNYKIFIYMLIKDIKESLEIVNYFKKIKVIPFAQPYIDFSGENKVTQEQKRFARWVNHKAIFNSINWEDYNQKGY